MTNPSAGAGRDGRLQELVKEKMLEDHIYAIECGPDGGHVDNHDDQDMTFGFNACPHPDCVLVRTPAVSIGTATVHGSSVSGPSMDYLAVPDPVASDTGQGVCKTCRGSGFVAYWDGGAYAGEGCPDCLDHPEMMSSPLSSSSEPQGDWWVILEEHTGLWWAPRKNGYTDLLRAGLYTEQEASRIASNPSRQDRAFRLVDKLRECAALQHPSERVLSTLTASPSDDGARQPQEWTALDGSLTIRFLQYINHKRAERWHGLNSWSALEWAGAMAGEAGEACNAAKKLKRIEDGIANINLEEGRSLTDVQNASAKIVDEIADTVIYGVLLASRVGMDLEEAIRMKFNRKSEEYGFPERIPPNQAPTAAASDDGAARPQPAQGETRDDMRVIHSSEIADDPAAFEGDYVPLEDVEAAIAHKLAALSSPSVADSPTWQPIDTHDGSSNKPVLVADRGDVVEAYFSAEHDAWWEINSCDDGSPGSDRRVYPTHWMPLPNPPSDIQQKIATSIIPVVEAPPIADSQTEAEPNR